MTVFDDIGNFFTDTIPNATGGLFDKMKDFGGGLFDNFKGVFSKFFGGGSGGGDDTSTYITYALIAIGIIILAVLLKKLLF